MAIMTHGHAEISVEINAEFPGRLGLPFSCVKIVGVEMIYHDLVAILNFFLAMFVGDL